MRRSIGINREQKAAVAQLSGPVRVVAGAGTGKTAVIAQRFLRLVDAGTDPSRILVMTFTERAAAEMRGRIEAGLGNWMGELWIGTFHSTAQALLREEGWRIGVHPSFRVLAGADRWILMRELLWELGDPALVGEERPDDLVNPLLRLLERMKEELVSPSRLEDWALSSDDREAGAQMLAAVRLFRAYGRRCQREGLLDFDDLILRLVELVDTKPEARALFVKRFTSVLVDEYQDSNLAQERMVELLGSTGNVCVVGDDDQSIYRFRGASLASMERFLRAFPKAVTRTLGRNRRSTKNVVVAAAALIGNNPNRLQKSLSSVRLAGPRVMLVHAADSLDESLWITDEMARLAQSGIPAARIALLVRTNALSRPIVLALRAAAIPYQLWGARGFYRRPEILDLIAYFRVLLDPGDEIALARLAGRPSSGLDLATVLERLKAARTSGAHPLTAFSGWSSGERWLAGLRRLIGLSSRLGVDDLFFELMTETGYLEVAGFESEVERRQVAANVAKFAELLDSYCERSRDHSIGAFMAYLDLVLLSETEEVVAQVEEIEDAIQIMTIHQAKGLEFEAVFIPSLVEGRLPQPHRGDYFRIPAQLAGDAAGREDQTAEERRLLYVAMTRARDRLHLSWADRYEGSRSWRPSRFLAEIEACGTRHLLHREVAPLAGRAKVPGTESAATAQTAEEPATETSGRARSRRGLAAPDPPGVDPIPLSFSGISTYRECPRQFQYRYVYQLPLVQSVEAQYGSIVHHALMLVGRARRDGREVDAEAVRLANEEAWAELPFSDQRRRPAMHALSSLQLERFRVGGGFDTRPALLEEPFSVVLDSWRLRGIIDRIDPPPGGGDVGSAPPSAGTWRLVDYKTGDPIPASRLRRDLQLALYALGAGRALGLEQLELEIVYLKDASRVLLAAGPDLLAEAEKAGAEVAAGVRERRFEPRPERRRCALCPYRLACPAAL
ncbi:MAG: hypothetical protein NVS9B1_12470 [Candidatus Dormibacteraceae bacterium]